MYIGFGFTKQTETTTRFLLNTLLEIASAFLLSGIGTCRRTFLPCV